MHSETGWKRGNRRKKSYKIKLDEKKRESLLMRIYILKAREYKKK